MNLVERVSGILPWRRRGSGTGEDTGKEIREDGADRAEAAGRAARGEKMKVLVISDSHGVNGNLRYAIGQEMPIDLLIHCGDIEGDLLQILGGHPPYEVKYVRGNMDRTRAPETLLFEAAGCRIFVAHGHTFDAKISDAGILRAAKLCGAQVACYGHSHIPEIAWKEGVLVINPGSISYPHQRSGKKTYAVLTLEEGKEPEAELKSIPARIPDRW